MFIEKLTDEDLLEIAARDQGGDGRAIKWVTNPDRPIVGFVSIATDEWKTSISEYLYFRGKCFLVIMDVSRGRTPTTYLDIVPFTGIFGALHIREFKKMIKNPDYEIELISYRRMQNKSGKFYNDNY